jgi:hypothetical protein
MNHAPASLSGPFSDLVHNFIVVGGILFVCIFSKLFITNRSARLEALRDMSSYLNSSLYSIQTVRFISSGSVKRSSQKPYMCLDQRRQQSLIEVPFHTAYINKRTSRHVDRYSSYTLSSYIDTLNLIYHCTVSEEKDTIQESNSNHPNGLIPKSSRHNNVTYHFLLWLHAMIIKS